MTKQKKERFNKQLALPKGSKLSKVVQEIIDARKLRGISRQELAEMTGTTYSMISKVERGDRSPSIHLLEMYAFVLGGKISFTFREIK